DLLNNADCAGILWLVCRSPRADICAQQGGLNAGKKFPDVCGGVRFAVVGFGAGILSGESEDSKRRGAPCRHAGQRSEMDRSRSRRRAGVKVATLWGNYAKGSFGAF